MKTIIEEYVATGAPVGSRSVSKKSGLKLSAASMRSVMADLTDKGLLNQPHTSAGRVPSPEAFRFYLRDVVTLPPLSREQQTRIGHAMADAGLELKSLLGEASRLASSLTNQVGMIVTPSREDARWREIDFVRVKPGLVLAVLVLEGGIVQNKLLQVDANYSQDDLVTFSNYLNDHFRGRTLTQARGLILQELQGAKRRLQHLAKSALDLADSTFADADSREVIVEGAVNIFAHAEFAEKDTMREIVALLEERSRLLELLDKTIANEGVNVTFCSDVPLGGLDRCSLVSTPYGGEETPKGVVGIMGPVRMNYATVLPLVDYIAKTLTHILKQRF